MAAAVAHSFRSQLGRQYGSCTVSVTVEPELSLGGFINVYQRGLHNWKLVFSTFWLRLEAIWQQQIGYVKIPRRSSLSTTIKDSIADTKANTIGIDRAECELRPLLVLHIDQPNFQIVSQHEVHTNSRSDHKVSALCSLVRKFEVAQTDQGFDIGSVVPSAELYPRPNEVGGLPNVGRLTLFQPSPLRLEPSLPDWIDVDVDPRTLNFLLPVTRFKKGIGRAHRDIGARRSRSGKRLGIDLSAAEKAREGNKNDVLPFVHWNRRSLFRNGHVQTDKLGDTGPASRGDDEVVGAWRCTVVLDAAATGEAGNQDTESSKEEEAADQSKTPGTKSQQTEREERWQRAGDDQSAGMGVIARLCTP
jgi:hypothetical protein